MLNSMLVAVLAGVDIYYVQKDILLLARLARPSKPVFGTSVESHWAIFTLCCVVALLLRLLWSRRPGTSRAAV